MVMYMCPRVVIVQPVERAVLLNLTQLITKSAYGALSVLFINVPFGNMGFGIT